jgi:hypothetical protein
VLGRGDIAAAVFDDHLHDERHVIGQRRQHVFWVEDFDRFVGLDIRAQDRAGRISFDAKHAGRFAVILHDQRLHVEHDIGDVFENTFDRGELVRCVVNLDLRNGAAFQARKQHAAQAVADC